MGADYAFYVKIIETHARAFLALNILAIGRVCYKARFSLAGERKLLQAQRQFKGQKISKGFFLLETPLPQKQTKSF